MSVHQIPKLIGDLYKTTRELEYLFQRPFTPDGHLVGSIGEVVAKYIYGLELEVCSMPQIDAKTEDGRTVQIKLTSRESYGFRWSKSMKTEAAEILIALRMNEETGIEEVYNGDFPRHLLEERPDSRNGQLSIAASKLRERNKSLLPERRSLAEFNKLFSREARPRG
jgi:hypothetical protein